MKKILSKATACLLAFAMLIGAGTFSPISLRASAEDGETEVPEGYVPIYTVEDLDNVRNNLSGDYILMNDIKIPGGGTDENNYNCINTNFTPIDGNFTGTFDGNGYTLSNLFISDGALYNGLFSEVSGTIRNLNMYGVVSTCGDVCTGGIAGQLNYGGVIENCQFDGQVILTLFEDSSGTEPLTVGGIAGIVNSGRIRNCTNYGDVAISYDEYQNNPFIRATYVGGIAGQWDAGLSSEAELENCANYGNIILTNNGPAVVGGVLGYGYGRYGLKINACFNAGCLYVGQTETAGGKTVTIGGVVGELSGGWYPSVITNVYNIGYWDITSPADLCLGGVVGTLTNSSLTGAYNAGTVFHNADATIGGIAGQLDDASTFEIVYFPELYASARADAETVDGRYTWEELRQSWLYDTNVFEQPTWILEEGENYPYPQLIDNPFRAFRLGTGTEADPYQVRNMQELNAVRHQLSAYFRLMQDITCTTDHNGNNSNTNTTHPVLITGYQPKWYPIGSYRDQGFEGVFDGGGHTITGICAYWGEEDYDYDSVDYSPSSICYMGLFGCNRGLIQDLIVSNSLEAEGILDEPYAGFPRYETISIIGGIAGFNDGVIRHCTNKQSSTNNVVIGGIVGENCGIIEQCINEAEILGAMSAGGIAAYNSQTIRECANTSYWVAKRGSWIYGINDETKQASGGIAARNTGRIKNCYNTAQVLCDTFNAVNNQKAAGIANSGTIENCYNIGQVNQPKCGTTGTGEPIGGITMANVYAWNMDGKGTTDCFRTLEEMKQRETYAGFDFENIWIMPTADGYPFPVLRNVETTFTRRPNGCVVTKTPSRHVFLKDEKLNTAIKDGEYIMYYNDGTVEAKTFIDNAVIKQHDKYMATIKTLETVGKHDVQVRPNLFFPFYYYTVFEAVDEKLPVGIEITQKPIKTAYYEGEKLDLTGLEVTISYNTEQYETTDDYTMSTFDPNKIGTQTIIVTYGDFVDTFEVEVMAKELSSIKLTTLPAKTDYIEGYEEFDPTGGKVTLTYNNGTSEEIDLTADMVSGFDNTKAGKQDLKVTYGGFSDTFEVEIIDYIPGDVNQDGTVDSDDAIYLLYHTFLPQEYPVRQDCDFDKNGVVDSDDATYLLYHTFLPEEYPLY